MHTLIESVTASKGLYYKLLGPVCKKYNLTESEILILLYLADQPKKDTATDIAFKQGLKKAIISVSIKDLHERGLIEGSYLEDNHRSIHLEITDDAKSIVEEAKAVENECYRVLTDGLDNKDIDILNKYLNRITENIDNYKEK